MFKRRRRAHRVILYTQPNCHLCEEAESLLEDLGVVYEKAWDDRYLLRVPVIEVDGSVVAEAPVDPTAVRRALR